MAQVAKPALDVEVSAMAQASLPRLRVAPGEAAVAQASQRQALPAPDVEVSVVALASQRPEPAEPAAETTALA